MINLNKKKIIHKTKNLPQNEGSRIIHQIPQKEYLISA